MTVSRSKFRIFKEHEHVSRKNDTRATEEHYSFQYFWWAEML